VSTLSALFVAAFVLIGLALPGTAAAQGVYGSEVQFDYLWPQQTAINCTRATVIAAAGIEFTSGCYSELFIVDVQPTTVVITLVGGVNWSPAAQNGPRLTFTNATDMSGSTVAAGSAPIVGFQATANSVQVNWAGLSYSAGAVVTINLSGTFAPPVPTVTALSPTSGTAGGGTLVTLTGTSFTGATGVSFGATPATAFTVNSATQITATAPAGTGTVDVTVTTAGGTSATAGSGNDYTYTGITGIGPASLSDAFVASAYSETLSATDCVGPCTFAITAGALPAGLTLASDGTLSGTPTAGGSFNFTVTATDAGAGGLTANRAYSLTVGAPTVALSPVTLPAATTAVAYSETITASGGVAPYSYALTAGALPAGLTLASDGTLSGTPTAGGSFNFTVTATDSATGAGPYSGSRAYSLTVGAPTISLAPTTLPAATTAVAYSETITASGGVGGYTYALTAGALPAGLTLASAGTLSGTPTAGGSFNFTVTATDQSTGAGPYSGSRAYSLTVGAPTIALDPASLAPATAAVAYSETITASGGVGPYSYALTAGALPAGLTLASDGTLSGTPTAGGSFNFTVTATDSATGSGPYSASRAYSLTVGAPTISLSPTLPAATAAVAYSETITASGGVGGYTYALTAGALPAGLTLASDGTLSGTPTAGGSFNFTVTATDQSTGAGPYSGSRAYSLTVGAPTIALDPASLAPATAAVAYSETITASGGVGPYSYALTAGALPAGLTLASDGTLSGTPTAGGSFNFTVTATDSATGSGPYSASRAYSLTVGAPTISLSPTLPAATAAVAYSETITASGGVGGYTYALTAGALPAGMSLSSGGVLSGTPTAGGSFNFTVTATDSATGSGPYSGSRAYSLTVGAPTISLSPTTLPAATTAVAYSETITASGGVGGYTYALTAGALPAGLTLASDGTLSGTPTAGGSFNFTVTATDSATGAGPYTGSRAYSLTVGAPTISLSPASLPNARVAVSGYSQAITASGGVGSYTYALTAGALPTGMSLSSAGVLSGTPTAGGSFNFTVTATDQSTGAGPYTGSQAITLNVDAPAIVVTPNTVPAATRGSAYSQSFAATGGVGSYTYDVSAGALPAGTTLSTAGVLSGTPTVTGTFNVTIRATDQSTGAGPYSGTTAVTLVVNSAPITVTPTSLPAVMAGLPYQQVMSATGGSGAYSYTVTAGALPSGITLTPSGSAAGRLAGTSYAVGTFNFTVTATDAFSNTGSVALSLTIQSRPDPSQDPDVRGINQAQAEAVRRLTSTQIDNFSRRLEDLRDGTAGSSQGVRLQSGLADLGQQADPRTLFGEGRAFDRLAVDRDRAELYSMIWRGADTAGAAGMTDASSIRQPVIGRGDSLGLGDASVSLGSQNGTGGASQDAGQDGGVRLWTGGSITIGDRDGETGQPSMSVTSSGLSVGVDFALTPTFDLGFGGGVGEEKTDVGNRGSRVDSETFVGVVYGSWRPQGGVYIDGMVGYGSLSFDMTRRVAIDSSLVTGSRDGTVIFGSLGLGLDRPLATGRLSTYGRLESLNAELDAYTEMGSPFWALSYAERDVESLQGVIGTRYVWSHVNRDSIWSPSVRAEYRHELGEGGLQSLRYADWAGGPVYQIDQTGWERGELNLGLGLGFETTTGWTGTGELGARLSDGQSLGTLRLGLSRKF
jgi:uncharacterized protein YhjY with autotransporter beta-barrel domain